MAISEAYSGTANILSTEYSLVSNSTTLQSVTTDGIYQVFIDFKNMTVNDEYEVKIKEKVIAGHSQSNIFTAYIDGVQSNPLWVSPSLILLHGWDVTANKGTTTANGATISWSIRQIA